MKFQVRKVSKKEKVKINFRLVSKKVKVKIKFCPAAGIKLCCPGDHGSSFFWPYVTSDTQPHLKATIFTVGYGKLDYVTNTPKGRHSKSVKISTSALFAPKK